MTTNPTAAPETCGTCRFWRDPGDVAKASGAHCRRYPPVLAVWAGLDGYERPQPNFEQHYPYMEKTDWCGEWSTKVVVLDKSAPINPHRWSWVNVPLPGHAFIACEVCMQPTSTASAQCPGAPLADRAPTPTPVAVSETPVGDQQAHWTTEALIKSIGLLKAAGDRLSNTAQTSGGTVGHDPVLCEAIDAWSAERDKVVQMVRIVKYEGSDCEIGAGVLHPEAQPDPYGPPIPHDGGEHR